MDKPLPLRERRLAHEWDLIQKLMAEYPDKISGLQHIDDEAFLISVNDMPALYKQPGDDWRDAITDKHSVTVAFPRYFPSLPCEIFLSRPVFHPNVDPVNGFVCLWNRHRVANTVMDALARLAAVLAWRLYNPDAPHLMQPDALTWYDSSTEARSRLPLTHDPWIIADQTWERTEHHRRRRLS
jgi:ubiquitin-protein ligase